MKLDARTTGAAVDRPDPDRRFYLFHGPDESGSRALAQRLLTALGAEKFAVAASGIKEDPASLSDEAGAMALFGGPRAIWIEPAGDEILAGVEALLEGAAPESPVIAIGGALRKSSGLLKLAESHKLAVAAASYAPEGANAGRMVVDLGRVEFLDSTGLGVLVGAHRRLRARDGSLDLVCPHERLLKVFRITGLDNVFDIHASVEDATRGGAARAARTGS